MNIREDILKFIPKPQNRDVILYNTNLKELIDINVEEEYLNLYPVFCKKRDEFLSLKSEIKLYEENINNLYLYNPSWDEQDYLESLQNCKKTFSNLFGEIKRLESNISIYKKKIEAINEKINIQIAKDNKEIQNKKENLENDIEKNKEKLSNYKIYVNACKENLSLIDEQIHQNEEDFQILQQMAEELNIGECKCPFCGSKIKVKNEDSLIFKRVYKKITENENKSEKLTKQKEKLELNLAFYENELSKIKSQLNNNINFKKESKNLYVKKSLDVLKLEALKDELIKNIEDSQNKILSHPNYKSQKYKELKENILKYETSLNNLTKIKETKNVLKDKIQNYKERESELKEISSKLKTYINFLTIYYKIYEQKASEYCGNELKFNFFKVEDYKITSIFVVYYNGTEYSQLSPKDKENVDKMIIQKFSIFL